MAKDRLSLQDELRGFASKVWYKRPPDNRMVYPCILYRPSNPQTLHADNRLYMFMSCYNVIYISEEPNDTIDRAMLEHFKYCSVDRQYEADGLYHYSYVLYW